jgi:hypothetical protein
MPSCEGRVALAPHTESGSAVVLRPRQGRGHRRLKRLRGIEIRRLLSETAWVRVRPLWRPARDHLPLRIMLSLPALLGNRVGELDATNTYKATSCTEIKIDSGDTMVHAEWKMITPHPPRWYSGRDFLVVCALDRLERAGGCMPGRGNARQSIVDQIMPR